MADLHPKVYIFLHKDYFELIISEKQQTQEKLRKQSRHYPRSSVGKESACNAGGLGSIPESGRSPGEGNGNPLQHSCLEIPRTEEPDRLQSMGLQESDTT